MTPCSFRFTCLGRIHDYDIRGKKKATPEQPSEFPRKHFDFVHAAKLHVDWTPNLGPQLPEGKLED